MIKLPLPNVKIDEYIAQIVAERQNGRHAAFFAAIEEKWKARCHEYVAAGGDGSQIATWSVAVGQATSLKNLYSHPTENSVQGPVIAGLRDRTMQFCPLCGEPGTPNTLDHFLPQKDYPDYSILPANLIPTCDICQGYKLTKIFGLTGRLFIHPYFDDWLGGQVARLTIQPPFQTPSASLICHPTLPIQYAGLVSRHLAELALHDRFRAYFKKEYLRVLKLAARARSRNQDFAALVSAFVDHAADRSLNCWEHFFYEGVQSNQEAMEYLKLGTLPACI